MKANDEVPAEQGKVTQGFHCPGQPSRANLVAAEAQNWPKSRHSPGHLGNVGSKCQLLGSETRERGMSDEHNQCCSSTQGIRSPLH